MISGTTAAVTAFLEGFCMEQVVPQYAACAMGEEPGLESTVIRLWELKPSVVFERLHSEHGGALRKPVRCSAADATGFALRLLG